jgi:hypothetical protein
MCQSEVSQCGGNASSRIGTVQLTSDLGLPIARVHMYIKCSLRGLCHNEAQLMMRNFQGGEDSSRGLLGFDVVKCCGRIPTFQWTLLPPSSGVTAQMTST